MSKVERKWLSSWYVRGPSFPLFHINLVWDFGFSFLSLAVLNGIEVRCVGVFGIFGTGSGFCLCRNLVDLSF
jgi:hypothetical protein